METVRISEVAKGLGINKDYALRLAKKQGLALHYGKRNEASLSKLDAERLSKDYLPQKTAKAGAIEDVSSDGFGSFYIIQLLPDEIPDRIKIGYAGSVDQRCSDHRVTNPTLKLVRTWRCKGTWEQAAIASVSREGCTQIGREVFQGNVQGFVDRAEAFFAIMPNIVPLPGTE